MHNVPRRERGAPRFVFVFVFVVLWFWFACDSHLRLWFVLWRQSRVLNVIYSVPTAR